MHFARGRSGRHALALLLAGAVLCAAAVAGEAGAEISWDEIEAWAGADTPEKRPESKPEVKPAVDPKTSQPGEKPKADPNPPALPPPTTPPRLGTHKTTPPQCAAVRSEFIRRVEPMLDRQEKSRNWRDAWDYAYRLEQYGKGCGFLRAMAADPKVFAANEAWIAERMWQTAIMLNPCPTDPSIENCFNKWRQKTVEEIEAPANQPADKAAADKRKQQMHGDLAERDQLFKNRRALHDDLNRMEASGETDPKPLWELALRYYDDRPKWPLRHATVLYKLREWYPDHPYVKSGEAQYRLVRNLVDQLWLPKEAGDEAALLIEKWPEHVSVTNGDALWALASSRTNQARECRDNKKTMELYKEAQAKLVEFQKKYPKHGSNQPPPGPNPRTSAQAMLDDCTSWLKRHD